jgi:excisionase family DNA binding protein
VLLLESLITGQQLEVKQMSNEPEKWSSLEEIAEHLGVSKDTIRNWIKKGVIPHRRIGKQYKFKISEVDAWVDSGKSAEVD